MPYTPTYNIDYNFFRSASNINKGYFSKRYDQPTYLTFKLVFGFNGDRDYNTNNGNFDKMPHPLFNERDNFSKSTYSRNNNNKLVPENFPNNDDIEYSSINYLRNANEPSRAELLKTFITAFNSLQDNYQYYFQSVTGVNELLKVDPKKGIRVDGLDGKAITIKCLESLDLRVSYLMNLYKKIAWDDTYQKWVLPDMMRYFTLDIYVFEFRTFHVAKNENMVIGSPNRYITGDTTGPNTYEQLTTLPQAPPPPPLDPSPKPSGKSKAKFLSAINDINYLLPIWHLKCEQCEFDITNINNSGALSELSSNDAKEVTAEIKINVGQLNEIQKYGLFSVQSGDINQQVVMLNDNVINGIWRSTIFDNATTASPSISININDFETSPGLMNGINNIKSNHETGKSFNQVVDVNTDTTMLDEPGNVANPDTRDKVNEGNTISEAVNNGGYISSRGSGNETFLGNLKKTGAAYGKNLVESAIDKAKMTAIAGVSYDQVEGAIASKDLISLASLTKTVFNKTKEILLATVKPSELLIVEKIFNSLSIEYQINELKQLAQKEIDESTLKESYDKSNIKQGIENTKETLQKISELNKGPKSTATVNTEKISPIIIDAPPSQSTINKIQGGKLI